MSKWLVLAWLALAPQAWAALPFCDVIVQSDGTVLQGHVAELHPGDSITLVLLTGETRVVPWAAIASKRGPSFSNAPTPEPSEAPDADRRPGPGRVALHVESTGAPLDVGRTGQVEIGGAYFGRSRRAGCTTPCTLYVPPGALELYAGGLSLHSQTTTLPLEVPNDGLMVRVRPSSMGRIVGGVNLLTLSVGLILGPVFIGTAASEASKDPAMAESGWTMLGVGVAATAAGIVLIATGTTRIMKRERIPPTSAW
jgi:hypothetical protein